jgi:5-methyltetrahydropteroyltriglutamate--homocysteine methyltransferase
MHFRFGRASIPKALYPDLDELFDDLGKAYANAVRAFYDAGCRYLQFDDTIWAFLCSEKERAQSRQRGDNPDELPSKYAKMINQALAAKPADMTITTHVCRGNFRSTWIRRAATSRLPKRCSASTTTASSLNTIPNAPAASSRCDLCQRATSRSCSGSSSSKLGALEPKDDLKRRIDEAPRYVATEQLCLSPQCGFRLHRGGQPVERGRAMGQAADDC